MTSATAPVRPLLPVAVDAMRAPVQEGRTRPLAWRLAQLERLEARLPLSPCASMFNPARRWRLNTGTGSPTRSSRP